MNTNGRMIRLLACSILILGILALEAPSARAQVPSGEGAAVSEKLESVRAIARSAAEERAVPPEGRAGADSFRQGSRSLQLWAVGLTCFFLGGVVFFKGKQLRSPRMQGKPVEILSRTVLTPKSALFWVRTHDEEILVAAGSEPVTMLARRPLKSAGSFAQELLALQPPAVDEGPAGREPVDGQKSLKIVAGV